MRYHPYQLVAVAQRLSAHGLPMAEFAQSVPNLTEASSNLHELINGRNQAVYADAEMRLAVSRCVALETSRRLADNQSEGLTQNRRRRRIGNGCAGCRPQRSKTRCGDGLHKDVANRCLRMAPTGSPADSSSARPVLMVSWLRTEGRQRASGWSIMCSLKGRSACAADRAVPEIAIFLIRGHDLASVGP